MIRGDIKTAKNSIINQPKKVLENKKELHF
jgi:hypothetical protein